MPRFALSKACDANTITERALTFHPSSWGAAEMEGLRTRHRYIPDCINYSDVQLPVNWLPTKWESMPAGSFSENLRFLRQTHQLTQAELARRLGLAKQGYISNLEAGRKAPSLELVLRIGNLFGITSDELLRGTSLHDRLGVRLNPDASPQVAAPQLFGAKLRHLRLKHQVSQADLAQQLGLARQGYISNIEMGHRDPSLDMVIRIADHFHVSIEYLLRGAIPIDPGEGDTESVSRPV